MSVKLQTDEIRNGRRSWFHPKTGKNQQTVRPAAHLRVYSHLLSVQTSNCKNESVLCVVDYLQTRIRDFVEPLVSAWTHCEDKTPKTHCRSPRNNQSHNSNLSCLHFGFLWITQKKQRFCFSPLSPTLGRTCLKFLIAGGSSSMTRTCRC